MNPSSNLTARTPDDLLAAVPVILGFVPQSSVVMLTFGAPRTFHARVDLPASPDDLPGVVGALLSPASRHHVVRVAFVLYAADHQPAAEATVMLVDAFTGAGIEVVEVLRADGSHWFPLLPGRRPDAYDGIAYDVTAHPFVARSIVEGRVTLSSRAELVASLEGGPPIPMRDIKRAAIRASGPWGARQRPAEAAWVNETMRLHVREGTTPEDGDAARLLVAMVDLGLRDIAWSLVTRQSAPRHVAFWTDLTRRAPDPLLPAPAALLGFAAWQAGHGALAWCAVDRCRAVDREYPLAGYIAQLLTHAVPPSVWEPPDPDDLPIFDPA